MHFTSKLTTIDQTCASVKILFALSDIKIEKILVNESEWAKLFGNLKKLSSMGVPVEFDNTVESGAVFCISEKDPIVEPVKSGKSVKAK